MKPENTDREILEALLAGKSVKVGEISLRLGSDGMLESRHPADGLKWTKRPAILSEMGRPTPNRFEVIDHRHGVAGGGGRVMGRIGPPMNVHVSWQDGGDTLKIFLSDIDKGEDNDHE